MTIEARNPLAASTTLRDLRLDVEVLGGDSAGGNLALAVLSQTVKEPRTTLGGGCAEMLMAKAVEGAATRVEGKKQMAVASFAIALRQLPTILADNAGLDSSDLVARLRKAIYDGMSTYGLDLSSPGGGIADMRDVGVIESYKLKKAVVSSASEAAEVS